MTTPSPAGRIGSAPAERWPLTVLGRVLAPAGVRSARPATAPTGSS